MVDSTCADRSASTRLADRPAAANRVAASVSARVSAAASRRPMAIRKPASHDRRKAAACSPRGTGVRASPVALWSSRLV